MVTSAGGSPSVWPGHSTLNKPVLTGWRPVLMAMRVGVQLGSAVFSTALPAEFTPANIVRQDKDHIRLLPKLLLKCREFFLDLFVG
jgi:hypothetical protein